MDVPRSPFLTRPAAALASRRPTRLRVALQSSRRRVGAALGCWVGLCLVAGPAPAQTGPVLCTTTLEAPVLTPGQPKPARMGPTEVTRCGVVGTVGDLVERRYYSWRGPFASGVSVTHQLADFFGLAMGGRDGTKVMGLGFPDQAIIWDGTAIENTSTFLMDQQVQLVPQRTADLPTPFTTSLGAGGGVGRIADPATYSDEAFDPR